jgi:hypothetical protein
MHVQYSHNFLALYQEVQGRSNRINNPLMDYLLQRDSSVCSVHLCRCIGACGGVDRRYIPQPLSPAFVQSSAKCGENIVANDL